MAITKNCMEKKYQQRGKGFVNNSINPMRTVNNGYFMGYGVSKINIYTKNQLNARRVQNQQLPTYTTTERDNLSAPQGKLIYNTTTGKAQVYNGSTWDNMS